MAILVGVTFRKIGKLHYYAADDLPQVIGVGNRVIAHTERGTEHGEVKVLREVSGTKDDAPTPFRLLRVASDADLQTAEARAKQATDALETCRAQAQALRLPIKLTDAEAAFDGSVVTFYFVSDERVDFRKLVKETATLIKMRVHLHQVSSRDHAQTLGGYGAYGRPLCCTTFLRDFAPVSMKMAKDQSLYLNPSKFSGVCGKLMCCLRFEHEVYLDAKEKLPQVGQTVTLGSGERGAVTSVNIFAGRVSVQLRGETDTRTVTVAASDVLPARACGDCGAAGGGCGGECGSDTCDTTPKGTPLIALEKRFAVKEKAITMAKRTDGKPRGAKPFDVSLKNLIGNNPEDWLPLFDLPQSTPITTLDSDLASMSLAADRLYKIGDGDAAYGLHAELESGHTGNELPRRLL